MPNVSCRTFLLDSLYDCLWGFEGIVEYVVDEYISGDGVFDFARGTLESVTKLYHSLSFRVDILITEYYT